MAEAEKGDCLDFKLDGSLQGSQTYEGVDYSDGKNRGVDLATLMMMDRAGAEEGGRKRSSANRVDYADSGEQDRQNRQWKLPKNLRMPKFEEWQFYDTARLAKLFEKEDEVYVRAPPPPPSSRRPPTTRRPAPRCHRLHHNSVNVPMAIAVAPIQPGHVKYVQMSLPGIGGLRS